MGQEQSLSVNMLFKYPLEQMHSISRGSIPLKRKSMFLERHCSCQNGSVCGKHVLFNKHCSLRNMSEYSVQKVRYNSIYVYDMCNIMSFQKKWPIDGH